MTKIEELQPKHERVLSYIQRIIDEADEGKQRDSVKEAFLFQSTYDAAKLWLADGIKPTTAVSWLLSR